jgi:hypothetical protein
MIIKQGLRYWLVILMLMAVQISVCGQPIVINELMQSNVDVVLDDLKDFPDSWVELYNTSSEPVSLSDYKLGTSDKAANAWQLPSNMIVPAYGYLVVYCDKEGPELLDKLKATDGIPEDEVERGRLHTNFRLESGKGCVVYLFKNDILDEFASVVDTLKKQPAPNIAFGRKSDGSDKWGYERNATPGYTNGGSVYKREQILGEPIFSEFGSVKTDNNPILLTLSLPEGSPEGTCIYYSTNGKEPSEKDHLYTSPLTITQSTVVRAKLICDGWLSPVSTTHSYIFFPRQLTLPVISISTNEYYLYDNNIGIFPNNDTDNRNEHNNWRRPINFEYFEGEGTESILNQLCETRVGGGATREFSIKTLFIYAHKRFGEKLFDHEFFPDQKPGLHKFKSLTLRNAGNDFEYLYMRDAMTQRNMGMHTDIDWQAWRPAVVYINGDYYGMLNIRERAEEDNVYTNYDGLEDIDLFENWDNCKEGDWENLNKFKSFYNESGHTMAEFEQWMDCREFINLMIMNLFYCNLDFPGNNIVMWRPRTEGGRWRWIAKDVDYSMGLYSIPYNYETIKWFYDPEFDPEWHWDANGSLYTLLFRRLMEDETFRNEFVERYAIYAGDFLNAAGMHKVWDPMYERICYEFSFYGPTIGIGAEIYKEEMEFVDEWITKRTDEFTRQLCEFYNLTSPLPLNINTSGSENRLLRLLFNDHLLSESFYDGCYFPGHPIRLTGKAVPGLAICGWRVHQVDATMNITNEYSGPSVTLQMPECTQLTIEPVFQLAGDSDNNGVLDQTDIDALVSIIMSSSCDEYEKSLYDMNGDDMVNVEDLVKLISIVFY